MRLALLWLTLAFLSFSIHAESNSGLKKHFEEDQQIRSEESRQNGKTPDLKDEIARRLYVFSALANGDVNTADDFFYASIILQHTNLEFVGGELKSASNENHLLAYYLAQKAYQLGHEKGAWITAATYNRYLENAAIDVNKYGLKYDNTRVYLQNNSITDEERRLKGLPPVQSVLFSK